MPFEGLNDITLHYIQGSIVTFFITNQNAYITITLYYITFHYTILHYITLQIAFHYSKVTYSYFKYVYGIGYSPCNGVGLGAFLNGVLLKTSRMSAADL